MIISASRRTDIPNYYSEWLINRIRIGFVDVRNPVVNDLIYRIPLNPDVVDAFVFWTKNPKPIMKHLGEISEKYPFYFQFTITPYGKDVERNIPEKGEMINVFKELSKKIGRERVIWRYDPIFFSDKYSVKYHQEKFREMAESLSPWTEKCVFSILDRYSKDLRYSTADEDTLHIAEHIGKTTERLGMKAETCSEATDFSQFGINRGHCIDKDILERICGYRLDVQKDKSQRVCCGCMTSIDIGQYNTCRNGCEYCYAVSGDECRRQTHDPNSSLISGCPGQRDRIVERKIKSFRQMQTSLF